MNNNNETGNLGEEIATKFLTEKGYSLLHRNWRFSHWEVDIIVSKENKLHFIEVKTRHTTQYGRPEESIKKDKMQALKNAAEAYLNIHPQWKYIQFDVVAIMLWNDEPREIFLIEDIYF